MRNIYEKIEWKPLVQAYMWLEVVVHPNLNGHGQVFEIDTWNFKNPSQYVSSLKKTSQIVLNKYLIH